MATVNNDSFENKHFGEILRNISKFASNYAQKDFISKAEQIAKEYEWTGLLVKMLQYGNRSVLSNLQYRIRLDECEVIGCLAPAIEERKVTIRKLGKIEIPLCSTCMSKFQSVAE
jgi:hypothetical protein